MLVFVVLYFFCLPSKCLQVLQAYGKPFSEPPIPGRSPQTGNHCAGAIKWGCGVPMGTILPIHQKNKLVDFKPISGKRILMHSQFILKQSEQTRGPKSAQVDPTIASVKWDMRKNGLPVRVKPCIYWLKSPRVVGQTLTDWPHPKSKDPSLYKG